MKTAFADTSFFIAMLSPGDVNHSKAMALQQEQFRLITSQWILVELGACLSDPPNRSLFIRTLNSLESSPAVEIVDASSIEFAAGIKLYSERLDKNWSLVDCISFSIMQAHGLREALTADHHFQQAGFTALLR